MGKDRLWCTPKLGGLLTSYILLLTWAFAPLNQSDHQCSFTAAFLICLLIALTSYIPNWNQNATEKEMKSVRTFDMSHFHPRQHLFQPGPKIHPGHLNWSPLWPQKTFLWKCSSHYLKLCDAKDMIKWLKLKLQLIFNVCVLIQTLVRIFKTL